MSRTTDYVDIPNVMGIEEIRFKDEEGKQLFDRTMRELFKKASLVDSIIEGSNPELLRRGIGIEAPQVVADFIKKQLDGEL